MEGKWFSFLLSVVLGLLGSFVVLKKECFLFWCLLNEWQVGEPGRYCYVVVSVHFNYAAWLMWDFLYFCTLTQLHNSASKKKKYNKTPLKRPVASGSHDWVKWVWRCEYIYWWTTLSWMQGCVTDGGKVVKFLVICGVVWQLLKVVVLLLVWAL